MGLARLPGVKQVHDLHVWTITSGMVAVAVHIVALDGADHDHLLHAAQDLLGRTRHHPRHDPDRPRSRPVASDPPARLQ